MSKQEIEQTVDKLLTEKQYGGNQVVEVTGVRMRHPHSVTPYLVVSFKPIDVYGHVISYQYFQRDLKDALTPYEEWMIESRYWDVRKTRTRMMADSAVVISFQVDTPREVLDEIEEKIRSEFAGRTWKGD